MEKKDYYSLQSKYSHLEDYREQYRKQLLDFINDAFEKHGNEFEYKCDTHGSWKEKNEDEEAEFDAMNDLPECVTIWVDDDGGHELYPTCIRQYESSSGGKYIEADGWDWYDSGWVKYQQIHLSIDELQSVANFINAVLKQEQEGNIRRCDHCGKPMKEGYYLGGEFACSDECCLALYNGDKKQMEEDLSHALEDDGDCYWTEWESIYFDD